MLKPPVILPFTKAGFPLTYVWGAAKTVHIGQNKNFEITTWSYSSAFSEQFVLYLKVLAILIPEI